MSDARFSPDLLSATQDNAYYALTMFPYPSGIGLHCGHASIFTINDVVARFQRMQGKVVYNPFGFDAFGLPTENYAMERGIPAYEVTQENKAFFIKQVQALEISFDYERVIDTSDPVYYKRTQRIFAELFKAGLVYRDTLRVNRCPSCQTVLANDQVVEGKCERCKTPIIQKKHPQRFIKITAYADKLLADLDLIDRPEETKTAQRNWIGRSEGAEIDFPLTSTLTLTLSQKEREPVITVFTTRPDTLYGVTALVVAPEITSLDEYVPADHLDALHTYRKTTLAKTAVQRQQGLEDKTGVFSGLYALRPLTKERIPVWFADYVLPDYATGAVMFVPAHDERDWEFAKKFGLPSKHVIAQHYISWNAPVAGKENTVRHNVLCVLFNQAKTHVACLQRTSQNRRSFVMWGVDGEDLIVAGQREIMEETGYTDIAFLEQIPGEVHAEYYAAHKDVNRYSIEYGLVYQLTSEANTWKQDGAENHHIVRMPIDEVNDFLADIPGDVSSNIVFWKRYVATNKSYTWAWKLINSASFDGLDNQEAKKKIIAHLEAQGVGRAKISYKLRDWSVSRQRYRGSPVPIYYDEQDVPHLIPDNELPVLLPLDLENYKPSGKSPLEDHPTFPIYEKKVKHGILMCGQIWSWKSLGARYLAEKLGYKLFVSDEIRHSILKIQNLSYEEQVAHIYSYVEEQLRHEMNQIWVIIDATFFSHDWREKARTLLRKYGYEPIVCYVDAKQECIEQRLAERKPDDVMQFSRWTIDNYLEAKHKMEIPTTDEHTYCLDNNWDITSLQKQLDEFATWLKDIKKSYRRECDTLDTFMCSSFYFLRFLDPTNPDQLVRKEVADAWLPIELYTGGKEHTVGHLLYARFIHKFLYDQGYLSCPEPFQKLVHQGMVLWFDGRKMGKRYNNGIDPIEMVELHGADALRTYLMFMGPVDQDKTRNDNALHGVKKFLERIERILQQPWFGQQKQAVTSAVHLTIQWITDDFHALKLNTVVSKLMILTNTIYDQQSATNEDMCIMTRLLAPLAPSLADRLWAALRQSGDVHYAPRPIADPAKIIIEQINLPVQINGKMRGTLPVAPGLGEQEVLDLLHAHEHFAWYLVDKTIQKSIFVPDKIINIIVN